MITVEVIPDKIIYKQQNRNSEDFYCVWSCKVNDEEEQKKVNINPKYQSITVSGNALDDLVVGSPILLDLEENKKYPYSYNGHLHKMVLSDEPQDQWTFLKYCITPLQYVNFELAYDKDMKIVEYILNVDNQRDIIENVMGIGDSVLDRMRSKVRNKVNNSNAYILFDGYKITDTVIKKIQKHYSNDLELIKKILHRNVYEFTEVNGVGFKIADEIYLSVEGHNLNDKNRIVAGIVHVLNENMSNGNTRCTEKKLISLAVKNLGVKKSEVLEVISDMEICKETVMEMLEKLNISNVKAIDDEIKKIVRHFKGKIIQDDGYYTDIAVFSVEYVIYRILKEKSKLKPDLPEEDWSRLFKNFEAKTNISLSDEQQQFFREIHDSSLQFLVANGGTGKSMSQKVLLEYVHLNSLKCLLLAPTGRARKKLEEYTNYSASTIHSYLMKSGTGNDAGDYDVVLVDESSMIDTQLAYNMLTTLPLETKFIFVGDDAQIPSVSYGNFLYDSTKISSDIHVSRFSKVFRQSEGGILDIITKIRKGEKFLSSTFNGRKVFGQNCVFNTKLGYKEEYCDKAVETYLELLQKDYKVDDLVLLTPTNKGINGTMAINKVIQEALNPKNGQDYLEVNTGEDVIEYRVGDLIMNVQNRTVKKVTSEGDSEYYIANGESMVLKEVFDTYSIFEIEGNMIKIDNDDITNGSMQHGWCITAHKSQGSEYKVAICLVPRQCAFQMNGNLLYTMTSRAKEYLLVLGDMSVINNSMRKFENKIRETNLAKFFLEDEESKND